MNKGYKMKLPIKINRKYLLYGICTALGLLYLWSGWHGYSAFVDIQNHTHPHPDNENALGMFIAMNASCLITLIVVQSYKIIEWVCKGIGKVIKIV